ncbi:RICIN domain-containing protein, partial [Nonomuraea sp. NPDC049607]|uniref:RICIN domain-containing protein n=1 Tax=Nonomuraea sp. NPDC049607 TaxID=3154732 RepID=UPI003417FC73
MPVSPLARLLATSAVAVVAVAVAPAAASTAHAAQAGPPVCLDATNSRADNTVVRLWTCLDHPNQKWVVQNGHIKVEDTIGTGRE